MEDTEQAQGQFDATIADHPAPIKLPALSEVDPNVVRLLQSWTKSKTHKLSCNDAEVLARYLSKPGPSCYLDYSDDDRVRVIANNTSENTWIEWRRSNGQLLEIKVDIPSPWPRQHAVPDNNTSYPIQSILQAWYEGRASGLTYTSVCLLLDYLRGKGVNFSLHGARRSADWRLAGCVYLPATPYSLLVYCKWTKSNGRYQGIAECRKISDSCLSKPEEMPTNEWIQVSQPQSSSAQVFTDNSLLVKHNRDILLAYQTGRFDRLRPSYATALALGNFLGENEPRFEYVYTADREEIYLPVPGNIALHWRWSRSSGALNGTVNLDDCAPRRPSKAAAELYFSLTGRSAYLQGRGNQICPADVQALYQQLKTIPHYYHWDDGETLFVENPKLSGEFWKFRMSDWSFVNTVHYDLLQPISQATVSESPPPRLQCSANSQQGPRCKMTKPVSDGSLLWTCHIHRKRQELN